MELWISTGMKTSRTDNYSSANKLLECWICTVQLSKYVVEIEIYSTEFCIYFDLHISCMLNARCSIHVRSNAANTFIYAPNCVVHVVPLKALRVTSIIQIDLFFSSFIHSCLRKRKQKRKRTRTHWFNEFRGVDLMIIP